MTIPSEIRYVELTKDNITARLVWDINTLLPQLSSSAEIIDEDDLKRVFESGTRVFGAFDGERLVGLTLLVLMVILVGIKAWIEDVVVSKDHRKRGIASVLMSMAEEAGRLAGAKNINLTSKPTRPEAHGLYGGRGYTLRDTVVFRKTF